MQVTTIGLDIAKNVFQVHGIDAKEKVVVRKQLRRSQMIAFFAGLAPCLIGMEACATAHYWARELSPQGRNPAMGRAVLEQQHSRQRPPRPLLMTSTAKWVASGSRGHVALQ
jgi:hypothetical protein